MPEQKTYGGFFPLDQPQSPPPENTAVLHLSEGTTWYNIRCAIRELIRVNRIVDVLLPGYICPVVPRAVESAGAHWRTYPVQPGFRIDTPQLSCAAHQATLVIVPGYFGVYMPDLVALEKKIDLSGCRILLDYAQALYEPCPDRFAAVYSPRKFLGIPDGGILVVGRDSGLEEPPPPLRKVDQTVFGDRLSCHGIQREYPGGEVLDLYRRLERDMPVGPYRMSDLAGQLLRAFDHDPATLARKANYQTLLETLPDGPPPAVSVPMCFPLPVAPDRFHATRRSLISKGIFVPHYWPDLPASADDLGETVLALPIDHRYSSRDMAEMAVIVNRQTGGSVRREGGTG